MALGTAAILGIASAINAASQIGGGIASTLASRKQKQEVEDQRKKNEDWYNRRYNENPTQRADAQHYITMLQNDLRRRNRAAAGNAAVMGASQESVAAAKEAGNQALAQTTSAIAANNEQRKDRIDAIYNNNDAMYSQQLANLHAQRAQNIADALRGVGGAAASYGSALMGGK